MGQNGSRDCSPRSYRRIFTDEEIERLYAGAVRTLLEVGFRIQNRTILERLEQRGARTDYAAEVFWPTRDIVRRVEECARRHPEGKREELVLRRRIPEGAYICKNWACYYDWPEGVQRLATYADNENVLKAFHMLPEVARLGPIMTAHDVPPAVEPIVTYAQAITITDKPVPRVEIILPQQLPYLDELATISAGRDAREHDEGFMVNRFTVDARSAECVVATWRRNGLRSCGSCSCPIAGVNAPLTLAGALVVAVAETLGGWVASWALEEDIVYTTGCSPSVLDMRTTRAMFSTPEAVLIHVGYFQILDHLFGPQSGGACDYTDAKVPGLHAMNEKVFAALACDWLTGKVGSLEGTLASGKAFSPTQMVLDLEISRELAQLAQGMEVNDDTMALELIAERGLDLSQSFLDAEHTARHCRSVVWQPLLLDRTSWESPEVEQQKERDLLARADARWRDALARYEPPGIPEEKLRAVNQVVEAARTALL